MRVLLWLAALAVLYWAIALAIDAARRRKLLNSEIESLIATWDKADEALGEVNARLALVLETSGHESSATEREALPDELSEERKPKIMVLSTTRSFPGHGPRFVLGAGVSIISPKGTVHSHDDLISASISSESTILWCENLEETWGAAIKTFQIWNAAETPTGGLGVYFEPLNIRTATKKYRRGGLVLPKSQRHVIRRLKEPVPST